MTTNTISDSYFIPIGSRGVCFCYTAGELRSSVEEMRQLGLIPESLNSEGVKSRW